MVMTASDKSVVVEKHKRSERDTGSPEVQIALFSARINDLTEHFKIHVKDHHSRQGLLRLINSRRKLLDYLKNKDNQRYQSIIANLGLRR